MRNHYVKSLCARWSIYLLTTPKSISVKNHQISIFYKCCFSYQPYTTIDMNPLTIKNRMLENLLQTFYTVYLKDHAFGLFLAYRIFDVKYTDFMYHLGFSSWVLGKISLFLLNVTLKTFSWISPAFLSHLEFQINVAAVICIRVMNLSLMFWWDVKPNSSFHSLEC